MPPRETNLQLSGLWLMLLKTMLGAAPVFVILLIGWGTCVTSTLFELKSGSAVTESRRPGAVVRDAGIDEKLDKMQQDINEIKVAIAGLKKP